MSSAKDMALANNKTAETVKCVIRCRPLSSKEMQQGHTVCVNMNTKTGEIFLKKESDDVPK